MTKHTPGPWKARTNVISPSIHEEDGALIAFTASSRAGRDCDVANARLIAAAPAMLAALRNLLAEVTMSEAGLALTSPLAREHAAAAIAAAEGRADA